MPNSPDDTPTPDIPLEESPPDYQVAEARYFGLTPHVLAGVLALLALVAGVLLLAFGNIGAGVLLVVAGFLLAALFVEQARRRRASVVDRVAAHTVEQSRALAGFAGASMGAWTRAGRRATALRVEARSLGRQRAQLLEWLGAAAYVRDEQRCEELRSDLRSLEARIEACRLEARNEVERARRRMKEERRAVATTQVRPPNQ